MGLEAALAAQQSPAQAEEGATMLKLQVGRVHPRVRTGIKAVMGDSMAGKCLDV